MDWTTLKTSWKGLNAPQAAVVVAVLVALGFIIGARPDMVVAALVVAVALFAVVRLAK